MNEQKRARWTCRYNDQRGHPRTGVIRILLDEARIYHEHDAVDGDRRLRDIRREHDFARALGCRLKDLRLHVARQVSVNRTDDELHDLVAQRAGGFFQVLVRGLDLFLPLRVEKEDDVRYEDVR